MYYLAFDIECANNYRGRAKICSFGYVLADEWLEVLEKRDIIINPKAHFHPGMEKKGEIHLAYSKEEFKNAQTFEGVYEQIRDVMQRPDCLVIGHSVWNDVGYLRGECERYNLPQLEYRYIDAQTLHSVATNAPHVMSLEKIAAEFNIEFVAHKSDDDAYATLMYLRALCRERNQSVAELTSAYGVTAGEVKADGVIGMVCKATVKPSKNRRLDVFFDKVKGNLPNGNGVLDGCRICFNLNTERRNLDETEILISRINEVGGRVVFHARECNVFIYDAEKPCARCRSADIKIRYGQKIEYRSEEWLLAQLAAADGVEEQEAPNQAAARN